MNVRKSKVHSLVWPVLSLIAGITVASYDFNPRIKLIVSISFGTFILFVLIQEFTNKVSYYISLKLLCFILFFITGWGITNYQKNQYERFEKALSANKHPSGTIVDIDHFSKMTRIQIRVPSKNWWDPPHYFNINLLNKVQQFNKGQVIALNIPLKKITSSKNPFTFQAKEYWRSQNTSHEIFIYDLTSLYLIKDHSISFMEKIRRNTTLRIDELYPDPTQAGLLKALLLGQKEGLSKSIKEDFKKAGLMHILAVSGLHVGIISAILFFILLPIKLTLSTSWLHTSILLITLWLYAGITGMNTPVVRAVILANFYLTATNIDRKVDKWNIYLWAVLLILIIHPTSFFTISFQLSFAAVASILLFYKKYNLWFSAFMGHNYFTEIVALSLAAQTGIFPLLLYHFQEFSFVGTLSSLLVLPLLFPLILLSFTSVLLPGQLSFLSTIFSKAGQLIMELITQISNGLARWNYSSMVWVWNSHTLILIFIAILLAGLYLELKKTNSHVWVMYGSICFLLLAGISETWVIYKTRNHPILVVYENGDHPITELYFRGFYYTDYDEPPPPYLIRNRKKYYAVNSIIVPDNTYWTNLIITIKDHYVRSNIKGDNLIQIYNYSRFKDHFVQKLLPIEQIQDETYLNIFPLLSSNYTE